MRPKIGDLAIVMFEADQTHKDKWEKYLCLVTGRFQAKDDGKLKQFFEFIYWGKEKGLFFLQTESLLCSRFHRVIPKGNYWNGSLQELMIDNVVEI